MRWQKAQPTRWPDGSVCDSAVLWSKREFKRRDGREVIADVARNCEGEVDGFWYGWVQPPAEEFFDAVDRGVHEAYVDSLRSPPFRHRWQAKRWCERTVAGLAAGVVVRCEPAAVAGGPDLK